MATESTGARISRLVGSDKAAAVKLKLTERSDTDKAILLDGTDKETTKVLLGLLSGAAYATAPRRVHKQIADLSTCPLYQDDLASTCCHIGAWHRMVHAAHDLRIVVGALPRQGATWCTGFTSVGIVESASTQQQVHLLRQLVEQTPPRVCRCRHS